MSTAIYDNAFFESNLADMARGASLVVPTVFRFVQPNSVVDVGCGLGAWLRAFKDFGVKQVVGIDGDYVNRSALLIQQEEFSAQDLNKDFDILGKYDLAVCLEVAEHLPETSSQLLVRKLTEAAPVVLFSAAIPGQGGKHHINEQWPKYWQVRFERYGYERLDCIRPFIWQDDNIPVYYRQNILLYCAPTLIAQSAVLQKEAQRSRKSDLELISKDLLAIYDWLPGLLQMVPHVALRGLKRRLRGDRT